MNSIFWKYDIMHHSGVLSAIFKFCAEDQTFVVTMRVYSGYFTSYWSTGLFTLRCQFCWTWPFRIAPGNFVHIPAPVYETWLFHHLRSTAGSVLIVSRIVLIITCFIGLAYLRIVLLRRDFPNYSFSPPTLPRDVSTAIILW